MLFTLPVSNQIWVTDWGRNQIRGTLHCEPNPGFTAKQSASFILLSISGILRHIFSARLNVLRRSADAKACDLVRRNLVTPPGRRKVAAAERLSSHRLNDAHWAGKKKEKKPHAWRGGKGRPTAGMLNQRRSGSKRVFLQVSSLQEGRHNTVCMQSPESELSAC